MRVVGAKRLIDYTRIYTGNVNRMANHHCSEGAAHVVVNAKFFTVDGFKRSTVFVEST